MCRLFKIIICSVISSVVLIGCATTPVSLVVETYNEKAGQYEKNTYSNYFMGGKKISDDLMIVGFLVLDEKKVSPLYSLQKAVGALGPDDLIATGKLNLVFDIKSDHPVNIEIVSLKVSNIEVIDDAITFSPSVPSEKIQGFKPVHTNWYSIGLPVSLSFKFRGKEITQEINFKRLTPPEVNALSNMLMASQ